MNYKPYTPEWSRKRYLSESIQKYFDSDASLDTILDDIVSVLEENIQYHENKAKRFQDVLDNLKSTNK